MYALPITIRPEVKVELKKITEIRVTEVFNLDDIHSNKGSLSKVLLWQCLLTFYLLVDFSNDFIILVSTIIRNLGSRG